MKSLNQIMMASVLVNIFLAVFKIITGTIAKSSALIADGIHSFSDLVTDFFAIIGNTLALKPADQKHPYGHGKIEYLTSILIGFIIIFVGFEVIQSSIKSEVVIPNFFVLIVSMITIIIKLLLSEFVIRKGKKYKNNILIASGKESRMDVISSFVVLLSICFMQFSKYYAFLKYSDKIAGIIVGIFIIYAGFSVVKENMSIILGEQEENEEYLLSLKELILKHDKIFHIDSLVLLKFGSVYKLTLTVSMDGNIKLKKAHEIIDKLEEEIKILDPKIEYINIHMEPN